MTRGKRELHRKWNKKGLTALLAVALILCCTVGGTLAWLADQTDPVVNTFTPTQSDIEIEERFDGTEKSDIKVTVPDNGKNIPVYIRVTLVATWEDSGHNPVAKKAEITLPKRLGDGWVKGSDDYYYYTKAVSPGESTTFLFGAQEITVPTEEGLHMNLQVLADAVQADGEVKIDGKTVPAVETVWPVKVVDGKLTVS